MCVGSDCDWTIPCMSSRANACHGTLRRVCSRPNVGLEACLECCRASSQNETEFFDRVENDSERGGREKSDAVANESSEWCVSSRLE